MNFGFLALLDSFVSFFRDEVFPGINTSEFAGSNVRDILGKYFEENLLEKKQTFFGSPFWLCESGTNF